jgi:predicted enzyme related to lactoylglutathione lyase
VSNAGNHGVFVWHELMTADPEAAATFYRNVVGWETRPWGHHVAYTLCVAPVGPVAGIMALPEDARAMGAPPAWLSYLGTPDLDATIAHATGLGGRVLKGATAIEGAGRYAVLADPQGASFGVYAPTQSSAQPAMGKGQFVWHELATDDIEAALGYYRALFGWSEVHRMDMGAMGPYVIFGREGVQLGGVYRRPAGQGGGASWLAYTHVASAEAATAAAVAAGARVLHGPADVPGGRISMLVDPQGVAFAVHSATMPAAEPASSGAQSRPKSAPRAKPKATARRKTPARVKEAAKRKAPARAKAAAKRKAPARANLAAKRKATAKRKLAAKRGKPARKRTARQARARGRAGARKHR